MKVALERIITSAKYLVKYTGYWTHAAKYPPEWSQPRRGYLAAWSLSAISITYIIFVRRIDVYKLHSTCNTRCRHAEGKHWFSGRRCKSFSDWFTLDCRGKIKSYFVWKKNCDSPNSSFMVVSKWTPPDTKQSEKKTPKNTKLSSKVQREFPLNSWKYLWGISFEVCAVFVWHNGDGKMSLKTFTRPFPSP